MGYLGNISPDERRRLDQFRSQKVWKEWISTLHPNTKKGYESGLFTLLGRLQLKPSELVQLAGNPETQKDLSKRVKIVFAQLAQKYSYSARNSMFASFKNFLALNEIALPLLGFKIKLERKVKPLFTWEDAERTISKASIEFQPIYRLMLWSALDIERFVQVNRDAERLSDIKRQIADERRDWIRIDVPKGRKSSPPFYTLVPRDIAKLLPTLDQQGKPITNKNSIHYHWGNALKRAGFQFKHFGPHNLRSAWMGEATRRKLEPVVREHQLGHMVDSENYQRLQQDETFVTEQFRKAWATEQAATTHDLKERDGKIERLEGEVAQLEMWVRHLAERPPVPPEPKKEEIYMTWDPEKLGKRLEKTRKPSKKAR
jgi:integrase